jgi:hypothetical protein
MNLHLARNSKILGFVADRGRLVTMIVRLSLLLLLPMDYVVAQDQHEPITKAYVLADDSPALTHINQNAATVANGQEAFSIFKEFPDPELNQYFTKCAPSASVNVPFKNSATFSLNVKCNQTIYAILHLLRWAPTDTAKTPPIQDVQAQNWYLYRFTQTKGKWDQEDISSLAYLPGSSLVFFVYIQLQANPCLQPPPKPTYDIAVVKKTPTNIAHLFSVAQAFGASTSTGTGSSLAAGISAAKSAAICKPTINYWGGGVVALKYHTSTITVTSSMDTGTVQLRQLSQTKYDNEGPLYWDLSFAVPIRRISQITVINAAGTLAPTTVDKTNVFAAIDGYIPPGLDPHKSVFRYIPHPLAGVAVASQPLHKILVGGAWGPSFSELYIGALFVKQPVFSNSSACSSPPATTSAQPTSYHFCTQLSIGLNLQVSSILDKITKK